MAFWRSPYFYLSLASLFWGGNFVVGSLMARSWSPVAMTFARWILALLILVPLAAHGGRLVPPPRHLWKPLGLMAVSGVYAFTLLLYLALNTSATVNASLIQSTAPIFGFLLAAVFQGESVSWRRWLGIVAAVAGVAFIVSRGHFASLWGGVPEAGDFYMLVAAFLWGVYTVAGREPTRELGALGSTVWAALFGLPLLTLSMIWDLGRVGPPPLSGAHLLGILYIALFPAVGAFLAWNRGLGEVGPVRAIPFNNLLPVFTALLAYLTLGEPIGSVQVAGGLLVILGVTVAAGDGGARERMRDRSGQVEDKAGTGEATGAGGEDPADGKAGAEVQA